MKAYVFDAAGAGERPFVEGAAAFGKAAFVWLHLDARNAEAMSWLHAQGDIPTIARDALVASETRPRSDIIGHGAIVNFRGLGATPEDDPDPLVSIRFWAESGRVLSVMRRTPAALGPVIEMFHRGEVRDPGDLLSDMARAITDQLDPDVAALGDLLDDCECDLTAVDVHRTRRLVSKARSQAIAYRRFVAPQRIALERLAAAPVTWLDDDDRAHLREAADRAARMVEELESVRERSALVHDELTDLRGELLDQRALLLAIVALIFLPLTFITGLFGMNFDPIPFQQTGETGFWVTTGASITIALGIAAWFVRAHWLSR